MALAHHTISVTLPDPLFRQLQYAAKQTARSVEDLYVSRVDIKPTADTGLPDDLANEIFVMQFMDDDKLSELAQSRVSDKQYQRQADLNEIWNDRDLTTAERAELDALVAAYDKAVLIRTTAISLLKDRGHNIDEYFRSPSHT